MKFALLWKAGASSISEILESEVISRFVNSGFTPVTVFGLFEINTEYETVDKNVSVFLCKTKEILSASIKKHKADFDCLLPVYDGMNFGDSLPLIADSFDIDNRDCVVIEAQLEDGSTANKPSPLNVAFSEKYFSANAEVCLDFLLDFSKASPGFENAGFPAFAKAELSKPENRIMYQLFCGEEIAKEELAGYIEKSDYILAEYVKCCIKVSDNDSLEEVDYSLLDKVGHFFEGTDFSYVNLKKMQTLLENQNWVELENFAGVLSLSASAKVKFKADLFKAIAKANLYKSEESFEILNDLIQSQPQNKTVKYLVAKLFHKLEKYADAVEIFNVLAQDNPQDIYFLKGLAYSQYKAEAYDKAIKTVEYMINVFDWDDNILRFLLHLSYMSNDMNRLMKYSRYLECYPPLPADFPEKEWLVVQDLIKNEKDNWVLDIGANEGLVTKFLLNWGHRCLAVEPDDELFSELEKIISDYPERAILEKCAASDSEGKAELYIGNEKGFNTLEKCFAENLDMRFDKRRGEKVVPLKTLKSILEKHQIGKASLLKMDIEGHKLNALKGLGWDKTKDVKYIFVEIEKRVPQKAKGLLYYLFANGFKYGLVFQHENENPMFYSMWKMEASDDLDLKSELGVFANVILSREPLFEIDENYFADKNAVFLADELEGRLL